MHVLDRQGGDEMNSTNAALLTSLEQHHYGNGHSHDHEYDGDGMHGHHHDGSTNEVSAEEASYQEFLCSIHAMLQSRGQARHF